MRSGGEAFRLCQTVGTAAGGDGVGQQAGDGHRANATRHRGDGAGDLGAALVGAIAHSRTKDLPDVVRRADIVVAAVGRPEMVPGDWIKPGATVIDVGINRIDAPEKGEGKTRLVGDCDYASCEATAGAITPVPGGVGPMTIACLLANTVTACCRANGLAEPEGLTA